LFFNNSPKEKKTFQFLKMEQINYEISEEDREEIEKLYHIIHSNKISTSHPEITVTKAFENENFIITDHILIFVQNMTKSSIFLSFLTFFTFL